MRQLLFILVLTSIFACGPQEMTSEYRHQMVFNCVPPMHNQSETVEDWSDRVVSYLRAEGINVVSFRTEKELVEPLPIICGVCMYMGDLLIIESDIDPAFLSEYGFKEL